MNTNDIIEEMKEEAAGSRGIFYENFGSGIHPALTPLSELLESTKETHPDLVEQVAKAMYYQRS